jgi:hypothetical protein
MINIDRIVFDRKSSWDVQKAALVSSNGVVTCKPYPALMKTLGSKAAENPGGRTTYDCPVVAAEAVEVIGGTSSGAEP